MSDSGLFTCYSEIKQIKSYLGEYEWYGESYKNIKNTVDAFLDKGFEVPRESGFVFYDCCMVDNTVLMFDPYRPNDHVCPVCGMNYKDEPFQRAWSCRYHSWLSQMSIYLGIVYQIEKDDIYAAAIRKLLLDYVKYYADYPNNDNELGPTKVFQSTYMESVWVTYLAGAYDMVRESKCFTHSDKVTIENDLFKVSASVIYDYDEKRNNRQAFNNSALCAVGYLTGDSKLIDYALNGIHGFVNHMNTSVLEDGLWYEGDNYHFATVPSILNIAEVCRHNGLDYYSKEFNGNTIKGLFQAPLMSLQPDLTFPSRKDSKYANHIAQKWYAGLYELAYSRYKHPEFSRILKVMYDYKCPENFNPPSAAGIMDVFRAEVSRRSHLDWRGFLNAVPDLGEYEGLPVTCSVNMKGTGLGVLRRSNGMYASLDYGKYGGGHGHPDRLNINFFAKGKRWLADFGTGNYYFDHLKWYRSTIGHNTVGVDGQHHLPVDGTCTMFAETSEVAVTSGKVEEIVPGVDMQRTVILLKEGLLFDFMEVKSEEPHQYHYSLHSFGELKIDGDSPEAARLSGENYSFIHEVYKYGMDRNWTSTFETEDGSLVVKSIGETGTSLYKGKAYGPPDRIPELFPVLIAERTTKNTEFVTLMESVEKGEEQQVVEFDRAADNKFYIKLRDGFVYTIQKQGSSWVVLVHKANTLCGLHGFGVVNVPSYIKVANPVEYFECNIRDNGYEISVPETFGKITIYNGMLQESVFSGREPEYALVNGSKYAINREEDGLAIRQNSCRFTHVNKQKLFAGLENRISIKMHNYMEQKWSEIMKLDAPEKWKVMKSGDIDVEPYSVNCCDILVIPALESLERAEIDNKFEIMFHPTRELWKFEVESPLEIDEWIPLDGEKVLKVLIKNKTEACIKVEVSFCEEPLCIECLGEKEITVPFDSLSCDEKGERISMVYSVRLGSMNIERTYTKALTEAIKIKNNVPVDNVLWEPNIHLNKKLQVRRNERHWGGIQDLSAEAMVCDRGNSLLIMVDVKDNCVLFGGGKFYFDNDSIQVYVDRRTERHRNIDNMTRGVYGLVLVPGTFENSTTVKSIGTNISNLSNIGVSTGISRDGYKVIMDIPWDCIGGQPKVNSLLGFDIIINDRDSGVRRDLQMLWSGCTEGERAYLMEEKHNPKRFGLILF